MNFLSSRTTAKRFGYLRSRFAPTSLRPIFLNNSLSYGQWFFVVPMVLWLVGDSIKGWHPNRRREKWNKWHTHTAQCTLKRPHYSQSKLNNCHHAMKKLLFAKLNLSCCLFSRWWWWRREFHLKSFPFELFYPLLLGPQGHSGRTDTKTLSALFNLVIILVQILITWQIPCPSSKMKMR